MGEWAPQARRRDGCHQGAEEASMKGQRNGLSEVAGVCHTLSWKWRGGDFWAMLFLEEGRKRRLRRGRGTGFEDTETII